MVGFGGTDVADMPMLDGNEVPEINSDIAGGLDTTGKAFLQANERLCFMGTTKVGDFDIAQEQAIEMLTSVNPHGKPNSDVVRPFHNGSDLVRENSNRWIIDFGVGTSETEAALYEAPFKHVVQNVKLERLKNNRKTRAQNWWLLGETLPAFRRATQNISRYIGTARVAKHRVFIWQDSTVLPDSKVIAIAFSDDFRFGILQSRIHESWTLATCGWHGIGNDCTYNPTECFETFPFPFPDDLEPPPDNTEAASNAAKFYAHITLREEPVPYRTGKPEMSREAREGSEGKQKHSPPSRPSRDTRLQIATAAKELNTLRERWLNPPEWTVEKILEFPGSTGGAWQRYLDAKTVDAKTGVGTVRYPRLEPRDADCAAKLKARTLTKLYNERPAWLDLAHKKLDAAVAAAYGFPTDLTDEQILEKLLALNLERAAEEKQSAAEELAEKKSTNKMKSRKAQREKKADEIV